MQNTNNLRIQNLRPLISPAYLVAELPISDSVAQLVYQTRAEISAIIKGESKRLLVIVGPCSIHDPVAALEYAKLLKTAQQEFHDELCIVMRVYFEKPRTTLGWKGLINDPNLDGSYEVNQGLRTARKLLLEINELGLPTGSEFLDTIIPQYISDLTSWAAIGARTTESQIHRELASGLSMAVGFKNGTSGNVQIAVDAVYAAKHPHHFLGVTKDGLAAIVGTLGNHDCHIILRGSQSGPNYDAPSISHAATLLKEKHLPEKIMVDCSHGNSNKDHRKQLDVIHSLAKQIHDAQSPVFGIMLESNLVEGKQNLSKNENLVYGQSITDACLNWNDTYKALTELRDVIKNKKTVLKTKSIT